MSYYDTNTEIANTFNVSKTTVTRWVEGSVEGRNNLITERRDKKVYVLKNEHNFAEMLKLKEEGLKYKASTSYAEVSPKKEFYEIFSEDEIAEIFNNLETKKEIADKFIYKKEGAKIWDEFYSENETSKLWSIPYIVEELLIQSITNIDYYTELNKLNIIDLGPGNSNPVKKYVEQLVSKNKVSKYVGVDISPDMLDISENHIKSWFPTLPYEKLVCDFENVNFNNFFLKHKDDNTLNLILHTGGTISNHSDRLKVIKNVRNAMGLKDLFIFSCTLDTISSRSELSHMQTDEADKQDIYVPELLGINVDDCTFELKYDHINHRKIKNLKLDKDYIINVEIDQKVKMLKFYRNEDLTVWQHYLFDIQNLIDEIISLDLNPVTIIQDKTGKQSLVICKARFNH